MFGTNSKPKINLPMLSAKADAIDQRIAELTAMSNGLRHAAVCPTKNHFESPTFQRLLRAASSGVLEPTKKKPVMRKSVVFRRPK